MGSDQGPVREKHHLYFQGRLVLATHHDGTLVRALLRTLASAPVPHGEAALRLRARIVVTPEGAAVVVDERLGDALAAAMPRLVRAGHRRVDAPFVVVHGAEVVLPDVGVELGVDGERFERSWPGGAGDDDLAAARLPVRAIVHWAPADSPPAAIAVARAEMVASEPSRATADVRRFLALVADVGAVVVPAPTRTALHDAIAGAGRAGPEGYGATDGSLAS